VTRRVRACPLKLLEPCLGLIGRQPVRLDPSRGLTELHFDVIELLRPGQHAALNMKKKPVGHAEPPAKKEKEKRTTKAGKKGKKTKKTAAPPPPEPVRGPLWYAVATVMLVVPCFWQPRLQAGDLASHIYNSWLAELIAQGKAPGLSIASQTTNVLFDLILSALYRAIGAGMAQRIAVSFAVLVFAWGAFAFVSTVGQRRAWNMLPWIALAAYGWVFHMGFFGFYLSLGLCFWALVFAWRLEPRGIWIAAALLALAYVAHALPVLWGAGILGYLWLTRRLGPAYGSKLLLGGIAAIVVLHLALSGAMPARWFPSQISLAAGVDQMFVFDSKYLVVSAATLLVWGLLFKRLGAAARGPLFQICVLTAAGIVLLPTAVAIPGYKHSLVYITERMSLALVVCVCGVLASAPSRPVDRYITAGVAVLFFGMLFRDQLLLNRFEDQVEAAVAQIPPMQRVILSVEQSDLRVNALAHMIDRACIGRCYSYANYEPSTAQFRVRVNAPNPIVTPEYADSSRMQMGTYVVKESDLPLYQLVVDEGGQMHILTPPAGQQCGITAIRVL
jgi:hypothetical protein